MRQIMLVSALSSFEIYWLGPSVSDPACEAVPGQDRGWRFGPTHDRLGGSTSSICRVLCRNPRRGGKPGDTVVLPLRLWSLMTQWRNGCPIPSPATELLHRTGRHLNGTKSNGGCKSCK
ncbi:uncharacterized protein BO66DRAFT_461917 [Aspergillus aculeatinus CBS 121060]|uniref:Uncharacterized protein n=1 Tax=Aspergillus aculeatinus CBS 121060 TaxID=1448322 RepID=A0ACD1GWJ2_9EURO|nr:hypothetical protein BO66DRAFT_461917 [Aspergillus aculeatinus CBS 121060]RAH65635.1 hypothetical protein BO66DRAFT_461917 [Aspergillus aculeatinus CBS 121060]